MTKVTKEVRIGEHTLVLETGEIARQADGAVFVNMGGTQLLVTVVVNKNKAPNADFFPLTVNYQEKTFAAGKIPGGFNRREGRPSELETLTSRLIDRPIRPLFPEGFRQEVQIVITLLSLNPDVQPDILALIGTSAALAIAGVPFAGPVGAMRVGYENGTYTLNPSLKANATSQLDLVVAGTRDAILMVESEAHELSEEIMLGAVKYGHEMMKPVIDTISMFGKTVNKPIMAWTAPVIPDELESLVKQLSETPIKEAYAIKDKKSRHDRLDEVRQSVVETLLQDERFVNEAGVIENLFGS